MKRAAAPPRHPFPADRLAPVDGLAAAHATAVRETLDTLARAPGRPAAMRDFDSLFRDGWRLEQLAGRVVVGLLCNFVPEELVIAAGAVPLRLEVGGSSIASASAALLPPDTCPEIKAIIAAELGGLPYHRRADLLVAPTACDGKKQVATLLGARREVFVLDLPQRKRAAGASADWTARLRELVAAIGKRTGRRLRRRALADAILLLNRRTEIFRALCAQRFADPTPLGSADFFLVMQAAFIADPAWWIARAEALLAELRARSAAAGRDGAAVPPARLLLTGSPIFFPDYRVLQLIDEAGGVVVADEMCSGSQRLYYPTVVDERTTGGLLRATADHALLPCTCPCLDTVDERIDRLLELAAQSGAQGVVHHTLRLCQLYDLQTLHVSAALKQRGLPLINIHTEHRAEEAAVVQNRLDAFLEVLRQ